MMKMAFVAVGVLLAGCSADSGLETTADQSPVPLPAELRERVALAPEHCVAVHHLRNNRSAGSGLIIFEGRGTLLYLNRVQNSCPDLDRGFALQTKSTNGMLCAGDYVEVLDAQTGFAYGACQIGAFEPYRQR